MTREAAKRLLKSLDYYLKNRFEDYGERNHDAMIMAIKALEEQSILDKIKADIAMYEADCRLSGDEEPCKQCTNNVFGSIYRIIDKYKAGSEEE